MRVPVRIYAAAGEVLERFGTGMGNDFDIFGTIRYYGTTWRVRCTDVLW
jgi:hypothetical protein